MSLHYNSDGDKLLTGSFDKTAMVMQLLIIVRFGTFVLESAFIFLMNTQERSQVPNLSLRGIIARLAALISIN